MSLRRIAMMLQLIFTLGSAVALAQGRTLGTLEQRFSVGVDRNNNPSTGCAYLMADGQTANGIDLILTTIVRDVAGNPEVVSVQLQRCNRLTGNFFGPQTIDAQGWSVGLDNGTAAGDVVETYFPIHHLGQTQQIRLVFQATSSLGGFDVMTETSSNSGQPILFTFAAPIPTLGQWGLIVFLLVLVLAGLWLMRRRPGLRGGLTAMVVLSCFLLLGFAGNLIVADGNVGDWNGVPAGATDPMGDGGDDSVDLLAAFICDSGDNLFMRMDVTNLENQAPIADDQKLSTLEDNDLDITLTATDVNGDTLSFSILTPPTNGTLGVLTPMPPTGAAVTYSPDADYFGPDNFTFMVDDGNGSTDTGTITITVDPVNDVPSFTAGPDINLLKDLGPQTLPNWAGAISNGPANESGQAISFVLSNDNNGLFSVQPTVGASGTLSFTTAADANGAATVTIQVMDDGGTANGGVDTSAAQMFQMTFAAVNDAPSFTQGGDVAALEDSGPFTAAAWATNILAGPPDESGQALTFNVTANSNPGLFSVQPGIDAVSGDLTFTPTAEANGSATLSLVLMDNGGTANGGVDTSPLATFDIDIASVNDQPGFTIGPDQTVLEDAGLQTINAWATAISAGPANESGQLLTFNITANSNPALFAGGPAVAADGTLSYTPADDANGTATLTLELMDDGGTANGGIDTSVAVAFDINVTAVNDVPAFTAGPDQAVDEDSGPQVVMNWATAISTGPADESGQTLLFAVTANTDPALFSAGPVIAADGSLSYTPAAGASGSAIISLTLMDDGGTADGGVDTSPVQMFQISVPEINDVPFFTAGPDQMVLEDAGAQIVNPWATGISPGSPGEAGQMLTFNITANTNPALFSAQPTVAADGSLSFTPAAEANGSAMITLELMDDGGTANGGVDTSPPQSFNITVTEVNDVPGYTAGPDQNHLEDAGAQMVPAWASAITVGPADESGQTPSFMVSANSNPGLFSAGPAVDGATGDLSYTLAAEANGTATISLVVSDDGGTANGGVDTSAPQMFDISVTAVNDEPGFTPSGNVTYVGPAVLQTEAAWAGAISAGPADEAGQMLAFNITGNTNPGLFAVAPAVDSASGDLTYTPANGANGTTTISLNLMDDGGTANGGDDTSPTVMFDLSVTSPNMAPSFTVGADEAVNEDAGAQNVAGWATAINDGDGGTQTLTFNITGNTNPGLFAAAPAVDNLTGNLTYTAAAEANGSAVITLELMDDGGTANGGVDTSPAQMFTITVNAVNDVPSFALGMNPSVMEDAGAQSIAAFASSISRGPADEAGQVLTFNITGNTNGALFSAAPSISAAGTLSFTPAAEASGSATITVELMDDGGTANGGVDTSATQMFDIDVTPVNDPPMAMADANYQTIGNVTLELPGAASGVDALTSTLAGVLANDTDVDSAGPLIVTTLVGSGDVVAPFTGTSAMGGAVELNADGSFHYSPPAGMRNFVDTFQYTVSDQEMPTPATADGTVTITVSNNCIWFIKDDSVPVGDGSSRQPFRTMAEFNAATTNAGDTIFVYEGTTTMHPAPPTPLDGQFNLLNNQILHGHALDLNVTHPEDASAVTLIAAAASPVVTNGAGDIVIVADDNTVQGLTLLPVASGAIVSEATPIPMKRGGTLTIDTVIANPAGFSDGFIFSSETGTINISNSTIQGLPGHTGSGVFIENANVNVNFSNTTITDVGTGLFSDSSTHNISFSNGSTINTNNPGFDNQAIQFSSVNGGSLSFNDTSSVTVANLGGGTDAITIDGNTNDFDLSFGPMTQVNIDASGGDRACRLNNFGAGSTVQFNGAFNITGAGGTGIQIDSSTGSFSFADLAVQGVTGSGLLVDGGDPTVTITLDGTVGITNNAGNSVEIRDLTGNGVTFNAGGTIDDNAGGILITGNNTGNPAISFNNSLDIDNTSGPGVSASNNAGAALSFANLNINATDQAGLSAMNQASLTVTTGAVTTTGAAGGVAVNITNTTTALNAVFTNVTANNSAGMGINLDSNTGTITFDDLTINTTGAAGFFANNAGTVNINTGAANSPDITTTNGPAMDATGTTFNAVLNQLISNTSPGIGIDLDSNAGSFTFTGIDVNSPTGSGVRLAANTATVTINGGDIGAAGGTGLEINGGGANITYDGTVTNTAARSVQIMGRTGGTVDLNGAVTDSGSGILVMNNTSATAKTINFDGALDLDTGANRAVDLDNNHVNTAINFNAGLDIDTTGGTGLRADGGGTVAVAAGTNTIDVVGGVGVSLVNTTVQGSDVSGGINLTRVSASGGFNGILLNNTGSGRFQVLGTGAANSGGIISGTTDGIALTGATNVNLVEMAVNTSIDNGVDMNTSTNVTLNSIVIDGAGSHGINGVSCTNFTMNNTSIVRNVGNADEEHGIKFLNLFGISLIEDTTIELMEEDGIELINNTVDDGNADRLTIRNCSIRDNNAAGFGENGLLLRAQNNAQLEVVVDGSTIERCEGDGINGAADGTNNGGHLFLRVTGTTLRDNDARGIALATANDQDLTFEIIDGTRITGNITTPLAITGNQSSILVGRIGNTTGNPADDVIITGSQFVAGGVGARGMEITADDNCSFTLEIDDVDVSEADFAAIRCISRNTARLNLNLNNNSFTSSGAAFEEAVTLVAGTNTVGDTGRICLNMSGNTAATGGGFLDDYRLRTRVATNTFQLQDFVGNGAASGDVQTWVNTTKTNVGTALITISAPFSASAGACPIPPAGPLF